MIDQDLDFPLSPDCWADGPAFYAAFLKAEKFSASVPLKDRGAEPDRAISQLTSHLYAKSSRPDALFRASLGMAEASTAVWLSKVRTIAEWFDAANDLPEFGGLEREVLQSIAKLSSAKDSVSLLSKELIRHGVILIHERAIPGMKVDGAVFKLPSGNPVVALSLRHARLDHYWFTLMHELAHVFLHSQALSTPIMDDMDEDRPSLIEREADRLAGEMLIPKNEWRSCPARYTLSEVDIRAFAKKLNIAPQIVAGRLRRELRRHDLFSGLVHEVNIREMLLGED